MKKTHIVIATSAVLMLLFVAATWIYTDRREQQLGFLAQEQAELFVRPHSQKLGSEDARVYLVEFMDPACETCSAFSPFVKQLMKEHPDRIQLVLRYAPFHQGADYFVRILEAARKQGLYWETLGVMYATQRYWASHSNPQPQMIWHFLSSLELDLDQLRTDMRDQAIDEIIGQDMADAKTLGVRKTPGFFVNGRPLEQFGREQLRQLVEEEVQTAYPSP